MVEAGGLLARFGENEICPQAFPQKSAKEVLRLRIYMGVEGTFGNGDPSLLCRGFLVMQTLDHRNIILIQVLISNFPSF